jgi:hypothetical protein
VRRNINGVVAGFCCALGTVVSKSEEYTTSVAEFGPRLQTTFVSTLPQMRLEPRAGRYEASWRPSSLSWTSL